MVNTATRIEHVDVLIVGAGISGIGAAYYPQKEHPGRSYAIDSFPDQQRRALTDHFDFLNVMSEPLMREAVDCLNTGRTC